MASSSIFISASDARQNPIRETIIHDEARGIESAILDAVRNGLYQATISSGTPLTSGTSVNLPVSDIFLSNDELYIPSHPFNNGDLVTVISNGVLPSPLDSTKFYTVIYIDVDHIKLAASMPDANSLRPIAIDFTYGVGTVNVSDPGSGYLSVPRVIIDAPANGSRATAFAVLTEWGSIDNISVISPGSGFTDIPSIDIQPQGSGAEAGQVRYKAVSVVPGYHGFNYRVGDVLTVEGGMGTPITATVTSVDPELGGVTGVSLNNPGSYYVLPNLYTSTTVLPNSGTGCLLNLYMGISAIDVMVPGVDYIAAPVVTISGGGTGGGATAEAVIDAGRVIAFNVVNPGGGYSEAPTITVDSGSSAAAIAMLQPTTISSIEVVDPGSNYISVPTVTITAPGSGATAGVTFMKILSATMANSGGGYRVGEVLLISGGAGYDASIQVTNTGRFGEILAYTLITGGRYSTLPQLSPNPVIGGSGRSASFNLIAGIESITPYTFGSGYTTPPAVIITSNDGNGSGAKAYATLDATSVDVIVVTDSGSGYTTIPSIVITSGSGAQAEATIINGSISSIGITDVGQNYTCIPTVLVNGNSNIAAATLAPTGIYGIQVVAGGTDWISSPTVFLLGGAAQQGDTVSPITSVSLAYDIAVIAVTNPGSGYDSAPNVQIAPPNGMHGSQAVAQSVISAGRGTVVVSLYPMGRDYWKVWKNQIPSNPLYTRPYAERMDTVIAYFTNLGYTITRQTNPITGNTIQWTVMW